MAIGIKQVRYSHDSRRLSRAAASAACLLPPSVGLTDPRTRTSLLTCVLACIVLSQLPQELRERL